MCRLGKNTEKLGTPLRGVVGVKPVQKAMHIAQIRPGFVCLLVFCLAVLVCDVSILVDQTKCPSLDIAITGASGLEPQWIVELILKSARRG